MGQTLPFEAVLKAAGISKPGAQWAAAWNDSQASFHLNELYFLQPAWLDESFAKLGLPAEIRAAFRQAQPFFARAPALQRLAWHCCHLLYQTGLDPAELDTWPPLPSELGAEGAMFYAFVCLAGLPHLESLHRRRGIDPAITNDTMADFALWLEHHHQQCGVWGLKTTILPWIYGYLSGKTVKLGRLQYKPAAFPYDLHVYRRRRDSAVAMLAGDGLRFRPDGQFDGANKIKAGSRCWTSRWSATPAEIHGYAISASGMARPDLVTLPTAEWDEVLTRQSPVMEVHIPAAGPLANQDCSQSLRQACAFFPAHYPEVDFAAFTCVSWLMDNQFGRHLPETSNILQFQRRFYLYPIPGANDAQTFERVFGRRFANIDEAPQSTSLQRILAAHVKAGGHWRNGGGFILRADAADRSPLRPAKEHCP